MINYINGDLIKFYYNYQKLSSIVHCISNDWALGAGIAKQLKSEFKIPKVDNTKVGQCVPTFFLNGGVILNLITKERYFQKPTYQTLEEALISLNNLTEYKDRILIMPKIGCGLDKLSWNKVEVLISKILNDRDIIVCYL